MVLQHWRGHSADMYASAVYDDVVADVAREPAARVEAAAAAGIDPSRVIVDPGIGFGKRGEQNWETLRGLHRFVAMGQRVLIGTSRQGALYHLIKGHFQRRLEALLPPEIPVEVITPTDADAAAEPAAS